MHIVGPIATTLAALFLHSNNKHQGYKHTEQYSMTDRITNSDDGPVDPNAVQESQIRKMTRLAIEYKAVNLSQGELCFRVLCPIRKANGRVAGWICSVLRGRRADSKQV